MTRPFVGTFELDPQQRVSACDAALCEIFGCEPSAVVGLSVGELVNPRDRIGSRKLFQRMQREQPVDLLVALRVASHVELARLRIRRRADGGWDAIVDPMSGPDDMLLHLVGVERRWNELFHVSDDGIIVLDNDGAIVEHNPAFYTLMMSRESRGAAPTDIGLRGRKLAELVGSELPGFAEYLASPEGEYRARTGAGASCLDVRARALEIANQTRIGTFAIVREVAGDEAAIAQRDAINRTDLTRARAFQQLILSAPPAIPGYDVELVYRPLDLVGGDLYDVALLPADRVRVFIADSTGHGIAAALVTMLLKSAYDTVKYTLGGPAAVLAALNDRVASEYKSFDTMFTGLVLDLSLADGELEWSAAGHPPPIAVEDGVLRELPTGGTVLGVAPNKSFPKWTDKLAPGGAIYLITDGCTEGRNLGNEYFGDARLHAAIQEADGLPHRAGDAIVAHLEAWLRPAQLNDDLTLIALRPQRPRKVP
jgi:sigma-B regulation protein RsbU (phosphoserine phosphatase)